MSDYLHPSFFRDDIYWFNKGKKLALRAQKAISGEVPLVYPVILPATKRNVGPMSYGELMKRALVDHPEDIIVDTTKPVVHGFLTGMEIEHIAELDMSPAMRAANQRADIEPIFRGDQYTETEVLGLSGGLYLPAVRLHFVPIPSE